MLNDGFFTGSGATGVPVDGYTDSDAIKFYWSGTFGQLGSGLLHFKNPGIAHGYSWMTTLSASTRLAQADTLLSQNIVRTPLMDKRLRKRVKPTDYQTSTIRNEILNATSKTRGDYITSVAGRYNLEPELVAGIILTEQRDQSEAEDVADYLSATAFGREASSIGLGQVTGTTARVHDLLTDIFKPSFLKSKRYGAHGYPIQFVLADEAVNIIATAKYIRMIADAGAQVQASNLNGLHMRDKRCRNPSSGMYTNSALRDLSVLSGHSSTWTTIPDSALPAAAPSPIENASDGSPFSTPSAAEWYLRWRGQYYVRLIGTEYTSCPFDPYILAFGITAFALMSPPLPGHAMWQYIDNACMDSDGNIYPLLACVAGWWGQWVSEAFDDCKRSPHI